jgi:hypothetical protein
LASPYATSPRIMRGIGQHDNLPVHIQGLPDVQRSALCAVLPWPRMLLSMTHQEPDNVPAFGSLTVSPCLDTGGCYHLARVPFDLLVVYHEQMSLYSANSSPCLEGRGLLGAEVER